MLQDELRSGEEAVVLDVEDYSLHTPEPPTNWLEALPWLGSADPGDAMQPKVTACFYYLQTSQDCAHLLQSFGQSLHPDIHCYPMLPSQTFNPATSFKPPAHPPIRQPAHLFEFLPSLPALPQAPLQHPAAAPLHPMTRSYNHLSDTISCFHP